METEAQVVENNDEAKAAFLIKKGISPEAYYIVRNLTCLGEFWTALREHFRSTSKMNIKSARRALREIIIKSCSFAFTT